MSEPESTPTEPAVADPSVTPAADPPAAPAEPVVPPPAPDQLPELVRVAKAERKAAEAIKDAKAQTARVAEIEAKQSQFNSLVAEGKLLEAAKIYFPNDELLADKLFWQLNDYVADLKEPAEPTVDEKIARALEAEKTKATEEATKRADEEKKTKAAEADKNLADKRVAYFSEARKVLAADPASHPLVTAKIIAGEIGQDEVISYVEAIGADLFKLGLSEADLTARIREETSPANILAALETVLAREAAAAGAPAPAAAPAPGAKPPTMDEITQAAIASIANRLPPAVSTVSSAAVQGAPPIAQKKPETMSKDELNEWAITETLKRRGATAAR